MRWKVIHSEWEYLFTAMLQRLSTNSDSEDESFPPDDHYSAFTPKFTPSNHHQKERTSRIHQIRCSNRWCELCCQTRYLNWSIKKIIINQNRLKHAQSHSLVCILFHRKIDKWLFRFIPFLSARKTVRYRLVQQCSFFCWSPYIRPYMGYQSSMLVDSFNLLRIVINSTDHDSTYSF